MHICFFKLMWVPSSLSKTERKLNSRCSSIKRRWKRNKGEHAERLEENNVVRTSLHDLQWPQTHVHARTHKIGSENRLVKNCDPPTACCVAAAPTLCGPRVSVGPAGRNIWKTSEEKEEEEEEEEGRGSKCCGLAWRVVAWQLVCRPFKVQVMLSKSDQTLGSDHIPACKSLQSVTFNFSKGYLQVLC